MKIIGPVVAGFSPRSVYDRMISVQAPESGLKPAITGFPIDDSTKVEKSALDVPNLSPCALQSKVAACPRRFRLLDFLQ